MTRVQTCALPICGKVVWDGSEPDGQPRRRLDVRRAKKEFGFKAKTELETGLKRTVQWYKQQKRIS